MHFNLSAAHSRNESASVSTTTHAPPAKRAPAAYRRSVSRTIATTGTSAWGHQKKELRSFAVERIHAARIANATAKNIAEKNLHEHFASAYGIFAGKPRAVARLVFSAFRARWVAEERWHPAQQGEFLPDGRYQLDIPYSDTRELIMDILKNGPDVEVIAPKALREEVKAKLAKALLQYAYGREGAPVLGVGGVME